MQSKLVKFGDNIYPEKSKKQSPVMGSKLSRRAYTSLDPTALEEASSFQVAVRGKQDSALSLCRKMDYQLRLL